MNQTEMNATEIGWFVFAVIYGPVFFIGFIVSVIKAISDRKRIKEKLAGVSDRPETVPKKPNIVFVEDVERNKKWRQTSFFTRDRDIRNTTNNANVARDATNGKVTSCEEVHVTVEQHNPTANGDCHYLQRHYLSEDDLSYLKDPKLHPKQGVSNPAASFNDLKEQDGIELNSMAPASTGDNPNDHTDQAESEASPHSPSDGSARQANTDQENVAGSESGGQTGSSPEKSPERIPDPTTKLLNGHEGQGKHTVVSRHLPEHIEKPPRRRLPNNKQVSRDTMSSVEDVSPPVHRDHDDDVQGTSSRSKSHKKNYRTTVDSPGTIKVLVSSVEKEDDDTSPNANATDRRRYSSGTKGSGDVDSDEDDTVPKRSVSEDNVTLQPNANGLPDSDQAALSVYAKVNEGFVKSTELPLT